jgi:hypothetical protein
MFLQHDPCVVFNVCRRCYAVGQAA